MCTTLKNNSNGLENFSEPKPIDARLMTIRDIQNGKISTGCTLLLPFGTKKIKVCFYFFSFKKIKIICEQPPQ